MAVTKVVQKSRWITCEVPRISGSMKQSDKGLVPNIFRCTKMVGYRRCDSETVAQPANVEQIIWRHCLPPAGNLLAMQNITKMASHRFRLAECFDPSFPTGVFFFLLCYRRVISHVVWLVVLTESRNSFSNSFCGTKKNVNLHVFFLSCFYLGPRSLPEMHPSAPPRILRQTKTLTGQVLRC